MPEAYTHIRVARAALSIAKFKIPCKNAYEMGANGPDPFLCAIVFDKRRGTNLHSLAKIMHTQKTGAFLAALTYAAKTSAQRSYALGFLTHYATDKIMHPYVAFQISEGQMFCQDGGHAFCESAMDSFFHNKDKGTPVVAIENSAPALKPNQLAEICALLRKVIKAVYNVEAKQLDIADCFNIFTFGHKAAIAKGKGKRLIVKIADKRLKAKGVLEGHLTPCPVPEEGFREKWQNPFTGQEEEKGPNALCMQSATLGAEYLNLAKEVFKQTITAKQFRKKLGNVSYETGIECESETVQIPNE